MQYVLCNYDALCFEFNPLLNPEIPICIMYYGLRDGLLCYYVVCINVYVLCNYVNRDLIKYHPDSN